MRFIIFKILFLLSLNIYSQNEKDVYRNKGFFNITKFSHYKINNAKLDYTNEDNSIDRVDVKNNKSNGNGIQTINGYFLSEKFSLGLGLGLERFNNPNINTLPIFLDVRYYFAEEFNSVFLYGNIGTNLKLGESFNKGAMLNIGAGYKFFVYDKKISLVPSIGYDHRFIQIENSSNHQVSDLTLSSLSFSLGILF